MRFKEVTDVTRHGELGLARMCRPRDGEAAVGGGVVVDGDEVLGAERIEEVVGVVLVARLDGEVVDHQGEGGREGVVYPETRGVTCWVVAVGTKVVAEGGVRDTTGLFKPVHALRDAKVDAIGVYEGLEVVSGDDLGGNDGDGQAHELGRR